VVEIKNKGYSIPGGTSIKKRSLIPNIRGIYEETTVVYSFPVLSDAPLGVICSTVLTTE
jgi:hypothetical protein